MSTYKKTALCIFLMLQLFLQNNAFAIEQNLYVRQDICRYQASYYGLWRYNDGSGTPEGFGVLRVFWEGTDEELFSLDGSPYTINLRDLLPETAEVLSNIVGHPIRVRFVSRREDANVIVHNPALPIPPLPPYRPPFENEIPLAMGLPLGFASRLLPLSIQNMEDQTGHLLFTNSRDFSYVLQTTWEHLRERYPYISADQFLRMRFRFMMLKALYQLFAFVGSPHDTRFSGQSYAYDSNEPSITTLHFLDYIAWWYSIHPPEAIMVEDIVPSDIEVKLFREINFIKPPLMQHHNMALPQNNVTGLPRDAQRFDNIADTPAEVCQNSSMSFDTKNEIVTSGIFKMNRWNKQIQWNTPTAITWIDLSDSGRKDFCVAGFDMQNFHVQCYKNDNGNFDHDPVLKDENLVMNEYFGQKDTTAIIKAGRDEHHRLIIGLCSGGRKSQTFSMRDHLSCVYYTQDENGAFAKMHPKPPKLGFPDFTSKDWVDWGWPDQIVLAENDQMHSKNRWWVDVTGDDRMSLCRIVGNEGSYRLACRLSLGAKGFEEKDVYSEPLDMGYIETRGWVPGVHGNPASYCRVVDDGAGSHLIRCTPFNAKTHQFEPDLNLAHINNWLQFRWVHDFMADPMLGHVAAACYWNDHHDWECHTSFNDFGKDPYLFHVGGKDDDSLGFVSFPGAIQKGLCYLFDYGHMACDVKDIEQTAPGKFEMIDKINSTGETISWGSGSIQDGHRAWLHISNKFNLYCRDDNYDMRCTRVDYQ